MADTTAVGLGMVLGTIYVDGEVMVVVVMTEQTWDIVKHPPAVLSVGLVYLNLSDVPEFKTFQLIPTVGLV